MSMVQDKVKYCPRCQQNMKYRGQRIWFCKNCKRSYRYTVEIIYDHDEKGKVKKNWMGKPKILSKGVKERSWKATR